MADNLVGPGEALDVSLPTIHSKFILLREMKPGLRKLATEHPLKAHSGTSVNLINYNRANVSELSPGVDLVQSFMLADTLSSYTPTEKGVKCILPDTTVDRISDPDIEGKVARIMNDAYAFQEDADLADEFVNFTTALGAASTILAPGHVMGGVQRVNMGNTRRQDASNARPEPPMGPVSTVLHPLHALTVVGRMIPFTNVPVGTNIYGANTGAHEGLTVGPGTTESGQRYLREGPEAVDKIGGALVYVSEAINVDANDDASSATFAKEGLVFVPEKEPTPWMERDNSARATEVGVVGRFGTGVWRPSVTGCEYLADASMPTS